jgi:hypothetical protein
VFIVHVTCSDRACAEEIEAVVDTLEEVDDLVCECGCGTVLVSIAELDTGAQVIELQFDRDAGPLAA